MYRPAPVETERKLFGTDGIRGVANVYPMTAEIAMQVGRAVAYYVRNGSHRHRIVVGKDTRLSGYMLETALAAGICSM
ncbi:MAG TPA: phosphoglucosamine mutase, partial [Myxococcales bacterium]|nr:phosphoglucosamine mutase [Myxococcales bacterium]